MKGKPTDTEHSEATNYLEKFGNRYVYNSASRLYEPEAKYDKAKGDNEENREPPSSPIRVRVLTDWLVLFISAGTLILLIATVVYTRRQWLQSNRSANASETSASQAIAAVSEAQKALNQSRRQFQMDQRPYVAAPSKSIQSPGFYENPQSGKGQITWDWHMANYGKTPAYGMTFKEEMRVGSGPFVRSYTTKSKDRNLSGIVVLPTDDAYHTVVSAPMSREEFTQAMGIDQNISIRIVLKYKDSYGSPYETGICFSHLQSGGVLLCDGNYIK